MQSARGWESDRMSQTLRRGHRGHRPLLATIPARGVSYERGTPVILRGAVFLMNEVPL